MWVVPPTQPLAYNAAELADLLGVSEWLVRRNVDRIPHLRLGNRLIFPAHAIDLWLERTPLVALLRGVDRAGTTPADGSTAAAPAPGFADPARVQVPPTSERAR